MLTQPSAAHIHSNPRPPSPSAATIDLAGATSPLSGTTQGHHDVFTGCGSTSGNTAKFSFVLQQDQKIAIGQTSNTFDSRHSLFWSESADPAAYSSANGGQCVDDPDTKTLSLTNAQSAPRTVWFVVNGYSSSSHGTFTISWAITKSGASRAARALGRAGQAQGRAGRGQGLFECCQGRVRAG